MVNIFFMVVMFVATVVALFVIPAFMVRRAVSEVVRILCQSGALDAGHARTPNELGLIPPAFFEKMTKPRDYKPQALRLLTEANLIRATEDGKVYLPRRELDQELEESTLVARQVKKALKRYTRNDGNSHNAA
jgi:hypothetical protein